MKILVLDGNQNQAVASVRSLARAGHTVYAAEAASWCKAAWSRASSGHLRYPDPRQDSGSFIAAMLGFARRWPGILILPMTETTTLLLSIHRDSLLSSGACLVLPDHSDLVRAFNKEETTQLARSLGVPIPKTTTVSCLQEACDLAASIRYPVVLKPRATGELSPAGSVRITGRPRYARNADQFDAAYRDLAQRSSAILVQEFVAGEGTGYFALMHHGELRAEFAHRRIRDVHPTGSGSAVRVSIEPDPEIRKYSLSILSALRWHGVAMVEYRKPAGSPPVFMEVNGRFWHSLPLACYAGVDFPALLARMAEKDDIELHTGYRVGVRCRWLLGDANHVVEVWKGPPIGYPDPYPPRLRTLLDVLTPVSGTYHDLFQWNDPLPELGDWVNMLARLFGKGLAN